MAAARTGSLTESQRITLDEYEKYRQQVHEHPDGGQDMVRFYDDWAVKRAKFRSVVDYKGPSALVSILSELVSDKTCRILDAASGTGMVGEELKGCGFTCVDALDPSQKAMDCANQRQLYDECICDTLDEHQTNIPNDRYDAVLMCGTFGIPGHVTDACFPELIRITKEGGYIIFTVSGILLDTWDAKLEAAVEATCRKGLWELVEYRRVPYIVHEALNEDAKVPVLRVLKK